MNGNLRIKPGRVKTLALVIAVTLSAIALAGPGSAESDYSGTTPTEAIGNLIFIILTLAFIIGGFVLFLIFYSIYKFREANPHPRKPPVTENKKLEIVWTAIPIVIIIYLAVISTQALMIVDDPPEEEAMVISVIGHQWFWEFVYPDGNVSYNEVYIEEGQLVIFELGSADVIHSFSLPEFYIKKDCVPGMVTKTWIKAEPAGTYQIFCAEFCGSSHHEMLADLIIFEPEEGRLPYGPPMDHDGAGDEHNNVTGEAHDHYYTPPSENREIYLYFSILLVVIVIITLAFAFRPVSDGKKKEEKRKASDKVKGGGGGG